MTGDDDDRLLLHALADQELDAATALALERRIAAEPPLAAAYEEIVALKETLGRVGKPQVSDAFHDRIAALAPIAAAEPRTAWRASRPGLEWRAMAASMLVAACLASGATYMMVAPGPGLSIEDQVVSGHRRSLLAASPIDIASSDRHTVKPWFDAKLGVSPPTVDLAAAGFPLVGGRVDIVGDKAVPSLVYRHREHLITVLAMPDAPGDVTPRAPVAEAKNGFNMVRWSQDGFRYWAVSDLDAAELAKCVDDLRAK